MSDEALHPILLARILEMVRITPTIIKITLGQKVKKARIPKPTGFGFGSFVRPRLAKRITVSNGPLPITNSARPIINVLEMRRSGRSWVTIPSPAADYKVFYNRAARSVGRYGESRGWR